MAPAGEAPRYARCRGVREAGPGRRSGERSGESPVSVLERAGAARTFLTSVRNEVGKVTWPTRNEVRGTTIIVLITVFFFGFYLYGLDIAMSYVSAFITTLVTGGA